MYNFLLATLLSIRSGAKKSVQAFNHTRCVKASEPYHLLPGFPHFQNEDAR